MLSKVKPKIEPLRIIIAKPFVGIHPNILSVFGLTFAAVFFFALIAHAYIVALFALIGTSFDMVDGTVARIRNKETPFGQVLDSFLDRISDYLIIAAFGFAKIVNWEIVIFLLLVSLLTSYIRHRGEEAIILHKTTTENYKLDIGMIERPERIIIVFLAIAFYAFFPKQIFFNFTVPELIFLFLTVLSCITIIQRLMRAYILLRD